METERICEKYWEQIRAGNVEAAAQALINQQLGQLKDTWGENLLASLNADTSRNIRNVQIEERRGALWK